MKVKVSKILFVCIVLSFIKVSFIPQMVLRVFKLFVLVATAQFLLKNKLVSFKHDKLLVSFCAMIIISSFVSYGIQAQFFNGIIYAILIFELFILVDYIVKTYTLECVLRILLYISVGVCLLSDVSMLLASSRQDYAFESKFTVAYWHLLLLAFYVMNYRKDLKEEVWHVLGFFGVALYSVLICRMVDCSTGLVGIVVFCVFLILPDFIKEFLANPVIAVLFLLGVTGTAFLWEKILELEVVQYIIEDLLHRNLTLTGRLAIYKILVKIVLERPLLGWGYETEIIRNRLYGNAQNGLLHLTIQYGVIGAAVFMLLLFSIFKRRSNRNAETRALLALLYSFMVMSSVEIVFSYLFFVVLAVYNADNQWAEAKKRLKKRKVKIKL